MNQERGDIASIERALIEEATPLIDQLKDVNAESFKDSGKKPLELAQEKLAMLAGKVAELAKTRSIGGKFSVNLENKSFSKMGEFAVSFTPAKKGGKGRDANHNLSFDTRVAGSPHNIFKVEIDPKTGQFRFDMHPRVRQIDVDDVKYTVDKQAQGQPTAEKLRGMRLSAEAIGGLVSGKSSTRLKELRDGFPE